MLNLFRRLAALRGRRTADLLHAILWRLGVRGSASTAVQRAVFTRIWERNEWGDPESRSGPGSTAARGAAIVPPLRDLFRRFSISTLLDAPCGDFNWMRHATDGLRMYTGVDVVAALIAANVEHYADARHRFLCRDLTCDELPQADAILCRDALVHLSFQDIEAVIRNFKRSGSRYLLATTFSQLPRNGNIRTGGWRPLNLQLEPFRFPEPLACIADVPLHRNAADKKLCLWRLDGLPWRVYEM